MRTVTRSTDSLGGPANRLIDMRCRRPIPDPIIIDHAWKQTNGLGCVVVSHGPMPWGGELIDPLWTAKTEAGTPQSVNFPAVTGSRWIFVEATFEDVTVKFTDSADYPLHDLTIGAEVFRFPLTLWSIKTASGSSTGYPIFHTKQIPMIPGWAPPRAS